MTSRYSQLKETSTSVVDVVNLGVQIILSPNPRSEEAQVGMDKLCSLILSNGHIIE